MRKSMSEKESARVRPLGVRIIWRDARKGESRDQFTLAELESDQSPCVMVSVGLLVCESKDSVTIALEEMMNHVPSDFRGVLTIPRENITNFRILK